MLDGSGADSQDSAAEVLGIKGGFPAKKALEGSQRLGTDGLRRAMGLLADADLDVRGRTGLDDVAVTEVLVAASPAFPRADHADDASCELNRNRPRRETTRALRLGSNVSCRRLTSRR